MPAKQISITENRAESSAGRKTNQRLFLAWVRQRTLLVTTKPPRLNVTANGKSDYFQN
ncbi:hypothetical protein IE4872_PC00001 (plasmid) [Rhizobium gallicum]|uniref:Uncharacterized protein n=1 Tax=Rhizobium gallicum TaxID=56730 RepID=A0A1L5NQ47_9HYPH|nr:hypothetical protein IE4872_PC00001 [Rhizobium gallicum]